MYKTLVCTATRICSHCKYDTWRQVCACVFYEYVRV
jgi:hypothetical protein